MDGDELELSAKGGDGMARGVGRAWPARLSKVALRGRPPLLAAELALAVLLLTSFEYFSKKGSLLLPVDEADETLETERDSSCPATKPDGELGRDDGVSGGVGLR